MVFTPIVSVCKLYLQLSGRLSSATNNSGKSGEERSVRVRIGLGLEFRVRVRVRVRV